MMITIIIEFNCYEARPAASVWLTEKPILEEDEEAESLPIHLNAVRLIGPVEESIALNMVEALKQFYSRVETEIVIYPMADD